MENRNGREKIDEYSQYCQVFVLLTLILYELPSITLGVRPAAPGYKKVRIAPVAGYLTNASGIVKTPAGSIRVSWKIENGAFKIDYEVPQNIEVVR